MSRIAITVLAVLLAAGAWLASHAELTRQTSPDGAFVAVVTSPRFWSVVQAMPGQGRDRPGRLRIERLGGHSCGSAPLDMVQMADDLRWAEGAARLPAVADWDLAACTVQVSGR